MLIKTYGISREQWTIIGQLYDQDGITQKELSERTLKDQAAVTRILDSMERKNLLKRQANPEDRRSYLIFLSESGRDLRNLIVPLAEQCLTACTEGMTENEVCLLKLLLRKLSSNLS